MMWDGAFKPFTKGEIEDHFKIVSVERDDVLDVVSVGVEFDKSPGQVYVYEIPADQWDGKKETISNEFSS